MRSFIFLMLCLLLFAFLPVNGQKHLDIANSFVGVTELTNNNDGAEVEMFQKSVNLKKGNAWCGAFVGYCLNTANVVNPKTRSGLARNYKHKNSIKANDVLIGKTKVPNGSLVIWEKGTTIFGHVGFVANWEKHHGTTIEGNTSSGRSGSQSDGDGVYRRYRTIMPANYFRITSFTIVSYEKAT